MKYERPEMDIIELEVIDIIRTSTAGPDENPKEDQTPQVPVG